MSGLRISETLLEDEGDAGFERLHRKPPAKYHPDGKRRKKGKDQRRKAARQRKYARQGRV